MSMPIGNSEAVYFVENAEEFDLPSVAIRPKNIKGGIACDGNPRDFKVWGPVEIDGVDEAKHPRKIIVHSEYGDVILVKMTNKIFEEHLREYVIGSPKFASDDLLQNFYLKNEFK